MAGHYSYQIDIDPAIAQINALFTEVILTPGLLTNVTISFTEGSAALAHCQILENEHVIFPSNPESSYAWNNFTVNIHTNLKITQHNNKFKIKTWNQDELFLHQIVVSFNVVAEDIETVSFLNYLRRLVIG